MPRNRNYSHLTKEETIAQQGSNLPKSDMAKHTLEFMDPTTSFCSFHPTILASLRQVAGETKPENAEKTSARRLLCKHSTLSKQTPNKLIKINGDGACLGTTLSGA